VSSSHGAARTGVPGNHPVPRLTRSGGHQKLKQRVGGGGGTGIELFLEGADGLDQAALNRLLAA
jgi:hypothetical protein